MNIPFFSSITFKILSIALVGSASFVLFLCYNMIIVYDNYGRINDFDERSFPVLNLLNELKADVIINEGMLTSLVGEYDEDVINDNLKLITQHTNKVNRLFDQILIVDPSIAEVMTELSEQFELYTSTSLKVIKSLQMQDGVATPEDFKIMRNSSVSLKKGVTDTVKHQSENFSGKLTGMVEESYDVIKISVLLGLFTIAMLSGSAWVVGQLIIRDLKGVNTRLEQMSDGQADLTSRLIKERNDEIGALVESFNQYINKLQHMFRTEVDAISIINKQTSELISHSNNTKESTQVQQAEISSALKSVEQLDIAASQVTQTAESASTQTENIHRECNLNSDAVNDSMASTQLLMERMAKAKVVVTQLVEQTDKIGSASDVIDVIAKQTDLLALNAAIEAAHAGEKGRGFAVVADEIRSLAIKTADSTREIRDMVSMITALVSDTVLAMEESQQQAKAVLQFGDINKNSLKNVLLSFESINKANTHLARAAVEQNMIIGEVKLNFDRIKAQTLTINDMFKATHKSSNEIASFADKIKENLKGFKI